MELLDIALNGEIDKTIIDIMILNNQKNLQGNKLHFKLLGNVIEINILN